MGNQLDNRLDGTITEDLNAPRVGLGLSAIRMLPWLDQRTAELVQAVTTAVAEYPEVQGIILFGSIARHDERPLADSEPSDVDLLLLVDSGSESGRLPLSREVSLHISIGQISDYYRDAPREVQITIAERDLADWDPLFVENVARDGVLLWARGPLPPSLAPVAERAARRS